MSNVVTGFSNFVRALVWLMVLLLLSGGAWMAYQVRSERGELERQLKAAADDLAAKSAQIDELTQENAKLSVALRLMKIDNRVAEITVLDQQEGGERPQTKFQFVDVNKDGDPLGEKRVFTIEGARVYVDALVIKYDDELVEKGDPFRSTSVCLFQRVFGEFQNPNDGFPIETTGSRPAVYSQGNEVSPLERDIWNNFWDYANNPEKAKKAGVRAVHAEAPSIRLEPGMRYRVELRASGGLTIKAETDGPRQRPAS